MICGEFGVRSRCGHMVCKIAALARGPHVLRYAVSGESLSRRRIVRMIAGRLRAPSSCSSSMRVRARRMRRALRQTETLFFFDPPYWQTQGYGNVFGREEYDRLAAWMRTMQGRAILTINDHPAMRQAFAGFSRKRIAISYTVGGSGRASEASEMICRTWKLNDLAPASLYKQTPSLHRALPHQPCGSSPCVALEVFVAVSIVGLGADHRLDTTAASLRTAAADLRSIQVDNNRHILDLVQIV